MKSKQWLAAVFVAVLALLASACSDSDDKANDTTSTTAAGGDSTNDTGAFPVTVTGTNGDVTISEKPVAIVSLSPSGTEMLFAIGAGDQVIAVDDYSYFPDEAPVTDLSGFQPNIEAIAAYEPDFVLLSNDPGDVADGLGKLDIPVLVLGAADVIDDVYTQLEILGAATGNIGGAAEVVSQMQSDIDEIVASLPEDLPEGTYFHELDEGLYTITSDTFAGQIYGILGLSSIADSAEGAAASGGYPQISEEFLLDADPDYIFLADGQCCGQDADTVAARPGWNTLSAVTNNNVVVLDEDTASRWGPRIVEHLRLVADAILANTETAAAN